MADKRLVRGESWRTLVEGFKEVNDRVDGAFLAVKGDMTRLEHATVLLGTEFDRLQQEVKRISCYEPGLRYWQLGITVWASTLDEAALRNVPEISFEEFQELRKAEWANVPSGVIPPLPL